MRQNRRFTLTNLKEYSHSLNIEKGIANSYASYGGGRWQEGLIYVLDGVKNQCVGYGYEYKEDGTAYQYHSMAAYTPFKFSFNGKSTNFKFSLTQVLCPYNSAEFGWAISTVEGASDFKNADSSGTTGVIKSGTFFSGDKATRKTLNICDITLDNEIKSGQELYFYIWPIHNKWANFHIFGNIVIDLTYTNYKKPKEEN